MKKLISYFTVMCLVLTCFSSVYGQWNVNGGLANRYYETRNFPALFNIRSVGIGNFSSNGFEPISALHVNTNFLDLSPNFPKGDVLMTTGPANLDNAWRMFTGTANGTERFSITTLANLGGIEITTHQNQPMDFLTNSVQRLSITASGEVIINSLECTDCLVMTKKNGQLYTKQLNIDELLTKIENLEQKLTQLENLLAEK
ncbi:MAG: hypothetical protein COA97_13155 [Flavobacteriales bacterium]|nr:MAG: hypothetical protein COA97_13155 [Flavobacteriales bacterium]